MLDRYFFVVRVGKAEDSWEHKVTGKGEDAGLIFKCFWLDEDEFDKLPEYYKPFLGPEYISSFF